MVIALVWPVSFNSLPGAVECQRWSDHMVSDHLFACVRFLCMCIAAGLLPQLLGDVRQQRHVQLLEECEAAHAKGALLL